jgi:hypothetical protein
MKSETTKTSSQGLQTGDETWVYCFDPDTKQRSSHWKSMSSPHAKNASQVKNKEHFGYLSRL